MFLNIGKDMFFWPFWLVNNNFLFYIWKANIQNVFCRIFFKTELCRCHILYRIDFGSFYPKIILKNKKKLKIKFYSMCSFGSNNVSFIQPIRTHFSYSLQRKTLLVYTVHISLHRNLAVCQILMFHCFTLKLFNE